MATEHNLTVVERLTLARQLAVPSQAIGAGNAQLVLNVDGTPAGTQIESPVLLVDPEGGAIDVLLPPEAECPGLVLILFNTADAAEALTVKEDGDTTTIVTLDQNQAALLHCDGTTWRGFIGGIT